MKRRARRNSEAVVVVSDPTGAKHTLSSFRGPGASFGAKSHVRQIRARAAHGGDYFTGWKAGYAMLKNRGKTMKRRTRRNPHALDVAWTGKKANYVSPRGNYGETGHSELAMHTGGAGKAVVRFALWKRPAKGYGGPIDAVQWAQVEYPDGKILDGTPHEVLPSAVLRIIGRGNYGSSRMPRRKEKLALWALSKGVAGVASNPGKRGGRCTCIFWHAITAEERKKAKKMLDYARSVGDSTGAMIALKSLTGKCPSAGRNPHNKKRVHRNVPETHPIFKAGYAVHKFMSYLDNAHLRIWRDVPLAAIYHGGSAAKRAFAASVATVQGRMKDLAYRLLEIGHMRSYKTLMKTPLRAIAGAFGLMEELRSDF